MLQQQGPVSWDAARQLATSIATEGASEPNIDPLDRIKLEQLARVAELQVVNATGLATSGKSRASTRGQWNQRALHAHRPLFEALAASRAPGIGGSFDDEADDVDDPMTK